MPASSSFNAQGPAPIGFQAQGSHQAGPFKFGTLSIGHYVGVYGVTDDFTPLPPGQYPWDNAGVVGSSINHSGVWASSFYSPGVNAISGENAGVYGASLDNIGVLGESNDFFGIWGWSAYGSSSGVVGQSGPVGPVSNPTVTTIAGVLGIAGDRGPQLAEGPQVGTNIVPPTTGVLGTTDKHPGVIGTSNDGIGVYGLSTGNAGVVGETVNPNSFAGYFAGNVHVTGNLTVAGLSRQRSCRFLTARNACFIAWRAQSLGSRISARADSSAGAQ